MVLIEGHKEVSVMGSLEKLVLREERRRTGRFMAVGIAIFLTLLGVYEAIIRGTPQYAALFAPALIMLVYILWILYASKHQERIFKEMQDALERAERNSDNEDEKDTTVLKTVNIENEEQEKTANFEKEEQEKNRYQFNRSYSIA